ncbi:hypothetical protein Q7P37_004143 [Cladosporium fusiforme]
MLGRARGLLRARVGAGESKAWQQCHTVQIRRYAKESAPGGQSLGGTGKQEQESEGKDTTQQTREERLESLGNALRWAPPPAAHQSTPEKALDKEEVLDASRKQSSKYKVRRVRLDVSDASPEQDVKQPPHVKGRWRPERLKNTTSFGIVTTSRPHETTMEELAQQIERMPHFHIPEKHDYPGLLVLLMTPGLARHALDRNAPNTVYQRFQLPNVFAKSIESITAVVDRLPSSHEEPEGAEGMAYMFLRNPMPSEASDQTPLSPSAQKPGTLKFRVTRPQAETSLADHDLQLPLAQTIFTTGMVSTLIRREYNHDNRIRELELHKEEYLESKTVAFPVLPALCGHTMLHAPLIPLTPFRHIDYVMGNIIRKLSSRPSWEREPPSEPRKSFRQTIIANPQDKTQSMSASQELEQAVSKYFDALDLAPEPVSVWALIVPRAEDRPYIDITYTGVGVMLIGDNQPLSSSWHPDARSAHEMGKQVSWSVRRVLENGGRLIKVLSGGGGWGKKAGLLSLDPDTEYSTRELRQDAGWEFNFDGPDDGTGAAVEAQQKQALGEIVKEGESIMFLLAPKQDNLGRSYKEAISKDLLNEHKPDLLLEFGAIPSSIDAIPERTQPGSEPATIQHYPWSFGMLSEGGMAVTSPAKKGPKTYQSKFDVPYGRFRFTQRDEYMFPQGRMLEPITKPIQETPKKRSPKKKSPKEGSPKQKDPELTKKTHGKSTTNKKKRSGPTAEKDIFERFAELADEDHSQSFAFQEQPSPAKDRKPHLYRYLAATWPFQVRTHELGTVISRYDDALKKFIGLGPIGTNAHDKAMESLRSQAGEVDWACLSRTQRKITWVQLCFRFLPRLERAVEMAEKRKAIAGMAVNSASNDLKHGLGKSSGRSKTAAARDLAARKRIHKTRLNALTQSCAQTAKEPVHENPSTGVSRMRRMSRKSPTPRQQFRYQRSSVKLVRQVESTRHAPEEAAAESHAAQTYLTPAERRQRHVDRQKLRSQRRARLFSSRMEWARRRGERDSAGADLWQQAQMDHSLSDSRDHDFSAWPRLAKKQSDKLAQEVEAFVHGSR